MSPPVQRSRLAPLASELAAIAAIDSKDQGARLAVAAFHARHGDRAGLAILDPERKGRRPWDLARVAELYGQVGDRDEVAAIRERVVKAVGRESEEQRVMILGELAKAYEWLGDEPAADELAPPDGTDAAGARELLGEIAARTGRGKRATKIAREVEEADSALGLAVRDAILEQAIRRGVPREATAALAAALELVGDDDAPALARYAAVALRLGDQAGALRLARRAAAADDGGPPYLDPWYLDLAEVYRAAGGPADRKRAAAIWKSHEDLKQRGRSAVDLATLGQSRAAHGYRAEASAWLERAVAELDAGARGADDPGWAREVVVTAYLLLGDVPAAIGQAAAIATAENRVRALLAIAEHCQKRAIETDPAIEAALSPLRTRPRPRRRR